MDEIGSGVKSFFSKTKEEARSQTVLLYDCWHVFSFLSVVPTGGLAAFPSSPPVAVAAVLLAHLLSTL